jgi:hypothetical protein
MDSNMMAMQSMPGMGSNIMGDDEQSVVDKLFKDSLNTGPEGGTSILALKKPQQSQAGPGSGNKPQYTPHMEVSTRDVRDMRPHQQPMQDMTNTSEGPPSLCSIPPPKKQPIKDTKIIKKLVNDLTLSLNQNKNHSKNSTDHSDNMTENSTESEFSNGKEKCEMVSSWVEIVKDAILFIVIYVIFSQTFIKLKIGNYIPQILPSDDKPVSITGHIIYGAILAIFFCLMKRVLKL